MCGSLLTNTGLFRTNRMAMQFNVGRQMACMVPQTRVTRRTSGSDGWMRPAPDFIAGVRKSDHSIGSGHRSRLACTCAAPFLHPQGTRWCLELDRTWLYQPQSWQPAKPRGQFLLQPNPPQSRNRPIAPLRVPTVTAVNSYISRYSLCQDRRGNARCKWG